MLIGPKVSVSAHYQTTDTLMLARLLCAEGMGYSRDSRDLFKEASYLETKGFPSSLIAFKVTFPLLL